MSQEGHPGQHHRRSRGRFVAIGAAVVVAGVLVGGAAGYAVRGSGGGGSTPAPVAESTASSGGSVASMPPASPSVTETPSPSPSPSPTPSPTPPPVAATTDGVLFPASGSAPATRRPIAVMIDDHWDARPQSGLASADIVYQAPAEGGIPRYMAIFQTKDPPSIGPVRSARLYFVVWAEEWRAMYVHVGGAPNALAYLNQMNGKYVWNADEYRWGGGAGYLFRITTRWAPHNVYTTSAKMRALAARLGCSAPVAAGSGPWTFGDSVAEVDRPAGGTITVPYLYNQIVYRYDPATNTYPRSVTGEKAQTDAGTKQKVAPSNVVVLYQKVGALANTSPGSTNVAKGRLEIDYLGSGRAQVFANGEAIDATWSKASETAPTLLTYATGPNAGRPVPLVRGQIFVQVVATGTAVTYKPAAPAANPSPSSATPAPGGSASPSN